MQHEEKRVSAEKGSSDAKLFWALQLIHHFLS
jgi:hypothetical protein